ncbi:MAG TPA: L-seryl-tRNA(Sec) selenium transferase [Planctomycetes bacterium]|nr:L-seryl-tRNA(Sec) selenium transferase [Planctomycetota bacterium]
MPPIHEQVREDLGQAFADHQRSYRGGVGGLSAPLDHGGSVRCRSPDRCAPVANSAIRSDDSAEMTQPKTNPYRLLPSVDEVLAWPEIAELAPRTGRELLAEFVGRSIDRWRSEIRAGELDAAGVRERLERGDLARSVLSWVEREAKSGLVPVVNATGVVLHTGLGRAPVHPEVAEAMARAASRYGTLEVDRFTGLRNRRDDRLCELLLRLVGGEAAIAVNNNAAAVLLLLNTFAAGKETVVSRGELVEIGGSFRMPDVMERAGTKLVEVGTTNRTRGADFRAACGERTGLLLKVHTSNFRVVGFTEEVGAAELADLGRELDVPTAFDLGSGLIDPEGAAPLGGILREPGIREAVASGIDVVTFSGDKLLGAPQAGVLVGKREPIARLRANPLYRALRLDKTALAGLEATAEMILAGRAAELPTRAMLTLGRDALEPVAERIAAALRKVVRIPSFRVEVVLDASQPGSGSSPDVYLPSPVLRIDAGEFGVEALAQTLRAGDPPVFARIHEDRLMLDPRTLLEGDEERLVTAFRAL